MEFIANFLDWYQSMASVLSPTLIVIFLLGLGVGTVQLTDDKMIRGAVIVVIAIILFSISFITTDFGQEVMVNLAIELLTALIAVLIVTTASQLESWSSPLAIVAVLAFMLIFFVNPENPATSVPGTFATALIGAYLTAWLIREEWSWSPQNQRAKLAHQLRALQQKQDEASREFGDFFVLTAGSDPAAVKERFDFLAERDMTMMRSEPVEQDRETELFYQLAHFKIETVVRDQETLFLANHEARVRVIGFPDTVKRVYKQMGEMLVTQDQKRIEAPGKEMLHIEFKTSAPQKLYSVQLEEAIFELARNWRHGDQAHLVMATDDLMAWAIERGLIEE